MLRTKPVFRKPPPPPPRRCCSDSDPHSDILSRESIIDIRSRPYYFRRCKKGMPKNIESLPTELLIEILLRVPADHLYERARLVCRRWYHIIHSHAFINAQMHGSTYGLLLSPLYDNTLPLYVTADADGGIHTTELNHMSKLGVIATCNGLVLELDNKHHRFPRPSNPATRQSFLLPPYPKGRMYYQFYCGLACSAASLVYKVIVPSVVFHSPPLQQIDRGLVVLTVGVDESWRHIEMDHFPDNIRRCLLDKNPLTSEGFVHWGSGRYCATMDVETEIITLSEAPYEYHESKYKYLSTGRCVSLLVACGDLSWEVWEMKAETGEWRKALPNVELGAEKCRIQQFAGAVLEPLGWVKYPHVLAFYFGAFTSGRHCILYNLDTHQLHSIELPQNYTKRNAAFPHKNSLMWLS